MSTYVREKVLRIPMNKLDMSYLNNILISKYADYEDDYSYYLEKEFSDIFGFGKKHMFQIAPTEERFIDYVLEYEWDASGEYGKTRALTEKEKEKYRHEFQKIDPNVNMYFVRLVEFCWYNCCEAPDYYDDEKDSFYDEA